MTEAAPKKRPVGRPSKYKPEYCERVVELVVNVRQRLLQLLLGQFLDEFRPRLLQLQRLRPSQKTHSDRRQNSGRDRYGSAPEADW